MLLLNLIYNFVKLYMLSVCIIAPKSSGDKPQTNKIHGRVFRQFGVKEHSHKMFCDIHNKSHNNNHVSLPTIAQSCLVEQTFFKFPPLFVF